MHSISYSAEITYKTNTINLLESIAKLEASLN